MTYFVDRLSFMWSRIIVLGIVVTELELLIWEFLDFEYEKCFTVVVFY